MRAKIVLMMLSAVPSLVWGQGKLRFDYEKEGEKFKQEADLVGERFAAIDTAESLPEIFDNLALLNDHEKSSIRRRGRNNGGYFDYIVNLNLSWLGEIKKGQGIELNVATANKRRYYFKAVLETLMGLVKAPGLAIIEFEFNYVDSSRVWVHLNYWFHDEANRLDYLRGVADKARQAGWIDKPLEEMLGNEFQKLLTLIDRRLGELERDRLSSDSL